MKREPLTHEELMTHSLFEQENGQVFLVLKPITTVMKSDLKALAFDNRGIHPAMKHTVMASLMMYQTLHEIRNQLLTVDNILADVLPANIPVDDSTLQMVDLAMGVAREGLTAMMKQINFQNATKKT